MAPSQDKQPPRSNLPPHPTKGAAPTAKPAGGDGNMDFGALDLSGGSEESLEIGEHPQAAKPEPAPARPAARPPAPAREAAPAVEAPRKAVMQRERERQARAAEPPAERKSKKGLVAFLLVLLVAGAVATGVYFFLQWQKSQDAAKAAEMQRLNQQSRDALMNDAYKVNP